MKEKLHSFDMGNSKYENGFDITLPLIFVNSMSDLFHEDIPIEFIKKVIDVINRASIIRKNLGRHASIVNGYILIVNHSRSNLFIR